MLIEWPGRGCDSGTCSYIVTTLISRQAEPTFDVHQPPPVIQTAAVGQQVNVSFDSNGKLLGLSPTVVMTGLPPGLTFNPASGKVSGKATTAGTYVVGAVATNLLPPQVSNLVFLWTVS